MSWMWWSSPTMCSRTWRSPKGNWTPTISSIRPIWTILTRSTERPLGIYAGRTTSLDSLPDNATIAVPNDTTNEARALLLLQDQGLIEVDDSAGLNATVKDITSNPKNIQITEIEAAQLSRILPDVDLAVINGNYAIDGGLKMSDALAVEESGSVATTAYPNVIAVRKGDENRPELQALVEALKSDTVKQYINETYEGSVVPID